MFVFLIMNKGSDECVFHVLCGRCRKFPTNTDPSSYVQNMTVVVRFQNERKAQFSQLGNNYEDVREQFQAGLPMGWIMWLDDYGIDCEATISKEEADQRGFVIIE